MGPPIDNMFFIDYCNKFPLKFVVDSVNLVFLKKAELAEIIIYYFLNRKRKEMKMAEKWYKLQSILNLLSNWIPKKIISKYKKLLSSKMRYFSLGEKFEFYYLANESHAYVPEKEKHHIGDFLELVDKLSA